MKRLILILAFLSADGLGAANEQSLIIGERIPDLKITEWLGERPDASVKVPSLIVFYRSDSAPCVEALPNLDKIRNGIEKLRIIIVAMEPKERIAPSLASYLGNRLHVGIDVSGRAFSVCGIRYVPFSVLVDSRGRALWIGNPAIVTKEELIKNIEQ